MRACLRWQASPQCGGIGFRILARNCAIGIGRNVEFPQIPHRLHCIMSIAPHTIYTCIANIEISVCIQVCTYSTQRRQQQHYSHNKQQQYSERDMAVFPHYGWLFWYMLGNIAGDQVCQTKDAYCWKLNTTLQSAIGFFVVVCHHEIKWMHTLRFSVTMWLLYYSRLACHVIQSSR